MMSRYVVYVSTLGAWVCHAAAPVMIRAMPAKNPKKEMIFVSMLAGVPTIGTGFSSFSMNHAVAIIPPMIRMYSVLFTKMLKSIFVSPNGSVLGYFYGCERF